MVSVSKEAVGEVARLAQNVILSTAKEMYQFQVQTENS